MIKQFFFPVIVAACAVSLTACESTKKQFDFSKKAPDEFMVTRHAPLEMPPSFEVRAPQPGAPRPQEASTKSLARQAILGEDAQRAIAREQGITQGEAVLLQKTGALNASPSIRAQVDRETQERIDEETPGIATLQRMVGQKPAEPSFEEVDPVAETLRIKKNRAAGKPVTQGKTPIKE